MQPIRLKEIFCVFDFNKESQLALAYASTLALHSAAHLHIIYMTEQFAAFAGFMLAGVPTYHNIFFDCINDQWYSDVIQDAIKRVIPPNISPVLHLSGTRVQNIVDVLGEAQADLCIIGIRSKTEWWKRLFSFPVTQSIMKVAPCPVVIINS
ncbi:MAG: universal stress protein [Ignavibacteriae bacterium]|nr:MAG: universal stress protein [Ignavibacteriota bacterium]